MKRGKEIRLLLVTDTPGHTVGYQVVARGLRDAGIEVILGGYRVPREIAQMAVQEDVDFIGYRIMDGAPNLLVPKLMEELKTRGGEEIQVIVGGIVPRTVIPQLKELGVGAIFPPGSKIEEIVSYLVSSRSHT